MKKILSIVLCLALVLSLASVVSAAETYGLVTDASKLADGQEIVILNNDFNRAMSVHSDNGKFRTDMEVTTSDNHATVDYVDGMTVVTLEKNGDNYALKVEGQYLACLNDGNNLRMQDTPAYWTISINDGGLATVKCVDCGERCLQYNASSPRFSTYKGTQADVAIYVKGYAGDIPVAAPTDPKEIVDLAFALAAGEKLPYTVTLTGKVTEITKAFDPNQKNVSVNIEVEGTTGTKTLLCYGIKGNGADTVAVGDTITVTGTIVNYNGTIEFGSGSSLDAVVPGTTVNPDPDPVDPVVPVVEIADGQYLIAWGDLSMTALAADKNYGYPTAGSLAAPVDADYFTIKNVGDGKFTIQDHLGRYYYMKGTYNSFNVGNEAIEGFEWVLEEAGEGVYYVKNVATGKYLAYDEQYKSFGIYEGTKESGKLTLTVKTVAPNPPAPPAPPAETGDSISIFVALMAVSALGITVIGKKKF